MKYFDTISPCISLCIMKTGLLFAANEFGNHILYKFIGLGDEETVEDSYKSAKLINSMDYEPLLFTPTKLKNLEIVDEISSLSPILDMKVDNILAEDTPQLFIACGKGSKSTLRLLRYGISVLESTCVELPEYPTNVFTLRAKQSEVPHKYLVVTYSESTMVLVMSNGSVNQIVDSELKCDTETLLVQLMADDSIVQVYGRGVRHILYDKRIREWVAPAKQEVEKSASNSQQVVLALKGGEVVYLELDSQTRQLVEKGKKNMGVEISAIDISPISVDTIKARFLAVACHDSTIRLMTLDSNNLLRQVGLQHAETAYATSLLFFDPDLVILIDGNSKLEATATNLILKIGLSSGVLMRVEIDRVNGQIIEIKWKFLGLQPLKLASVIVRGRQAMIALSKRPWIGYMEKTKYALIPISYDKIQSVTTLISETKTEGFVAVAGPKLGTIGSRGTLRFFHLEKLSESFSQQCIQLRFTPRRILIHPEMKVIVVCETENYIISSNYNQELKKIKNSLKNCNNVSEDYSQLQKKVGKSIIWDEKLGYATTETILCSSCLRVVKISSMETTFLTE